MLLIVPVFLYALFLDDLLRYSLDAQETAVSTVWDYTVQDYSTQFNPWNVQHQARLMFCDHESGIDSYQMGASGEYRDCEETGHHEALVAHVCWINTAAEQVTCSGDKEAASLSDTLHSGFRRKVTQGGLIRCSARAVVENYLLPKQFLTQFTKKDLSKNQWKGQGQAIHDNSKLGNTDNAYFLEKQQLAILTDTWALTRAENIRPGPRSSSPSGPSAQSRDLGSMVEYAYQKNSSFPDLKKAAESFFNEATNNKLLVPGIRKADDPLQPNIAIAPVEDEDSVIEKIQQAQGEESYFNTEWEDWDKDHHRKTYDRRRAGYLGCAPGTGC